MEKRSAQLRWVIIFRKRLLLELCKARVFGKSMGYPEALERKNELKRPLIANVDRFDCDEFKGTDFSYTLADRLIFLISVEKIKPIIVVNKRIWEMK